MVRVSSPWKVYGRILGTVVVATFLAQLIFMVPYGMALGEPALSVCGGIFAAPFVFLLAYLRRPRLIHVQRALPDPNGATVHRLAMGGALATPVPTTFNHHVVRDDSLLDTPPSKTAWLLFTGLLIITTLLTALYLSSEAGAIVAILLFIIIGIPAWLLGFSIPVMAWWSWCTRRLGLHTMQRESESWLVGGMLSAIPALTINSMLFPLMAGLFLSTEMVELMIPVISAPFGEEICKGLFVLAFASTIDSPRRGFQVGFTVGLGFAMLENLIYVLSSSFGGPIAFTFTTLVRGIGSIPGHAFWTGLTGVGLGYWLMRRKERLAKTNPQTVAEQEMNPDPLEWKLIDPKTGEFVGEENPESTHLDASELLGEFRLPLLEPMSKLPESGAIVIPKNPILGLSLAILGHMAWNGSITIVDLATTAAGWSTGAALGAQILLSVFLVAGMLLLGRGIVRGVMNAPTP